MENVTVKKATVADLELVYTLCRQSYAENFATHWKPTGLEWYFRVYSKKGSKLNSTRPTSITSSLLWMRNPLVISK